MLDRIQNWLQTARPGRLIPVLLPTLGIVAVGLFYTLTDVRSPLVWIVCAILVALLGLFYLILIRYGSAGSQTGEGDAFLNAMTLDLIVKMNVPAMICNSGETVIWYNAAFAARLGQRKITGQRFDAFAGFPLQTLKTGADQGVPVTLGERSYLVQGFSVASKGKRYFLSLWEDRTELNDTIRRMNDDEIQVAYIMVDNLEELSQYAKDGTRAAAGEIEKALIAWAEESNGILKEYQSDRYLFLFRSAEMAGFIEKKFDILDHIREIRIGESSLSLTISMGISQVTGTLSEKERTASEALDMALQRGGDQAVVKSEKGLEFYGGKSQTVQKRTKVRARVIANELASLISKSSHVLIMGHRGADFDCIGACLGVARLSAFCGVPFTVIANTRDPNFLKCREHIAAIPEYRAATAFCLAAEAQEMIGSDTLTVIVDVNNKSQFEAPSVAEMSHRTVYIDHHRKTAEFDEAPLISYIEPSASSACELISEILEQSMPSGMLTKEEADVMYAGILLDTKQFTRNTGVRTFSAALYLRGEGANPADAQILFKSRLDDFISEAKFESNVVIYRKTLAISCNDSPDNAVSDRIAAAKAADKLLTVEGVTASFALCRVEDKIHISARSIGTVNVQLILEKIEGGGHFDAAATQLTGTMNEALSRLKGAIDLYFEEIDAASNAG